MSSIFEFDLQTPLLSGETGTGQFIIDLLPTMTSPDLTFQHPATFEGEDYTLPIVAGVIGIVALSAVALYGLWNLDKFSSVAQGGISLGKAALGEAKQLKGMASGLGNPLKAITDTIEGLGSKVKNILPF